MLFRGSRGEPDDRTTDQRRGDINCGIIDCEIMPMNAAADAGAIVRAL
jgi:hypothetical protein